MRPRVPEGWTEALASKLYYFPAFPSTTPQLTEDGGWLDVDPFGSMPADKLAVLKAAASWSAPLGHPGSANPAVGEIFAMGILPMMFSSAASGAMSAAEAAQWAEDQISPIFERWRAERLVPRIRNSVRVCAGPRARPRAADSSKWRCHSFVARRATSDPMARRYPGSNFRTEVLV